MSATVAAILKKIAAAFLSSKKGMKTAGGILLGILIIIFIPIFTLLALFDSGQDMILIPAIESVVSYLDEAQMNKLEHVNTTMLELESAMIENGFTGIRIKEAHILFNMALFLESYQEGFVDKLVGCFQAEQTDSQLIAAVNSQFGKNIPDYEFTLIMDSIRSVHIDSSEYIDITTKNNLDLIQWAIHAEKSGWGYVWGTYGNVLDKNLFQAKLEQYPDNVGDYEEFIRENWLGKRTTDCVGLIKGYGWYDPVTGRINYATNGMPDINANSMYESAVEKGNIDTIPEVLGLAVWRTGHIGIYIGNGQVIESKGTKYGVIETKLTDGSWTHWLRIPYIEYIEPSNETVPPEETESTVAISNENR